MNTAILLSGGTGQRLSGPTPKQYRKVMDHMIITYALITLASNHHLEGIQIVADSDWRERILEDVGRYGVPVQKILGFSNPGSSRQESIYNGLKDLCTSSIIEVKDQDLVLIHDAARPLLGGELINRCFEGVKGHDGVMPVLPMKDTVYLSRTGSKVSELLPREQVFAGQAPELFSLKKYFMANQELLPDRIRGMHGSTEPAILWGMDIAMIPGDEGNFKITTDSDLQRFRRIMEERG